MRYSSLVQLAQPEFEIHFPTACRDAHLARLSAATNLLHPEPIADLQGCDAATRLAEVDILVTGWKSGRIDAELRRKMPRLKLVAHLAGTVKGILDRDAASSGLTVISGAEANARPVAEFTLAHILLHLKRVEEWRRVYRSQRTRIATRRTILAGPVGNTGRTVGIIGASRIGRRVAEDLRRHRVSVLLHDPFVSAEAAAGFGAKKVSMDDLLAQSDVVSLHQPLLPSTERSFGVSEFARMQDGALLINTARGRIIDAQALETAMADGRLFAVLDVTDPEPLPDASPLWDMPNVTLTPHIAGSFGCEVCDMTQLVLEDIERFTRGEPLQNEVIMADWERVA
ncbi:hydroxyacid dehydrogenase [Vannielia litorea]|uniref:Phosphoglycerate dehydrogenase n=1 Tax=Vannielia litorea TaxID=1217970 RepID=A0A1N6EYS1_9RHOB|nr:hydroxyacid dehydrogenase [Vannielia litorea]SIN88144.1 Phosphoglycerate dehydrogenase [Vannielia litorea]